MSHQPDLSQLLELPNLYTPRLILRKIRMEDAQDLYECIGDKQVSGNMLYNRADSLEHMRIKIGQYLEGYEIGECARWGAVERDGLKMIGSIQLRTVHNISRAAVGYYLRRNRWGCGYATEMLHAVLQFGFEQLKLNRIEGEYFAFNHASGRVMEKCGMQKEGVFRDYYLVDGKQQDVCQYAILRSDWIQQCNQAIRAGG